MQLFTTCIERTTIKIKNENDFKTRLINFVQECYYRDSSYDVDAKIPHNPVVNFLNLES